MTDTKITIKVKELEDIMNELDRHFGYCESVFALLFNYDSQKDLTLSNGISTAERLIEVTHSVSNKIWAMIVKEKAD